MTDGKTLNARNLERLGVRRLSELLIEIADTAAAKRRLRTELAGSFGAADVAQDIRRRLVAIRQAGGALSSKRAASLVQELIGHWSAVTSLILPEDPGLAQELCWEILALSAPIDRRAPDAGDRLETLVDAILPGLDGLLRRSEARTDHLADQIADLIEIEVAVLNENLISATADVLGAGGLKQIQARLIAVREDLPDGADWSLRRRQRHYDQALRAVADQLGDPDSFAATLSEADLSRPDLVMALATRLADAKRNSEAIALIDGLTASRTRALDPAFPLLKARVLAAEGDLPAAQAIRWEVFSGTLSTEALRAFIRPLPDFDDMEAEERAFGHAMAFHDPHEALAFLLEWPALPQAAALVRRRFRELDGNLYERLVPAAETLMTDHPLEAVLLLRAMIDHSLTWSRHSRYRHAARHLVTASGLVIGDWGGLPDHDAYLTALRRAHAKKTGFWASLADLE